MVSYEKCAYMWMTSPSGDADRGLSMWWLKDGGFQEGGSEGTRSSATRPCSLVRGAGAVRGWQGGRAVRGASRRDGKEVVVRQVSFHKYI